MNYYYIYQLWKWHSLYLVSSMEETAYAAIQHNLTMTGARWYADPTESGDKSCNNNHWAVGQCIWSLNILMRVKHCHKPSIPSHGWFMTWSYPHFWMLLRTSPLHVTPAKWSHQPGQMGMIFYPDTNGVSKNWWVYFRNNPSTDDLGVPPFEETSISNQAMKNMWMDCKTC